LKQGLNDMNEDDFLGFEQQETQESAASDSKKLIISFVHIYRNIWQLIKTHIWVLMVFVLVGAGITIYKILNITSTYNANILFMLKDDTQSSSSMVDPLSAFMLSRETSQSINIDKLKEISLSQRVLVNLLFSKCVIRGTEDYLINHYLKIYYNHSDSYFKNYRGLNGLNRNQYRILSAVIASLKRSSMNIVQNKSGAYMLSVKTIDEELSKVMCEIHYQNTSNFYIDKTTEKAQSNYIFLRNRLDSIRNMLYATEYQVANFEDRAHNLLLYTARVPQSRQSRNTQFYQTLYGETLKTFETSKVTLNNITPIFQILNRPYYPLYVERQSRTLVFIVGVVITGFIISIFLGLLYVRTYIWPKYRALINEAKEQEQGVESLETEIIEHTESGQKV
jgi:hypothetical protein